ncbi:MAG: 50S ribosomal protein L3 [bacterium]
MKFIIGEKLDMTQIWEKDRKLAVTRIKVGPCKVIQAKTVDKDGYNAVQLGYGEKKAKNIKKPQLGHLKNLGNFKYLREFRLDRLANSKENKPELKKGDTIDVSTFAVGDMIQVSSLSKGKGFQGVVKRHGFHGQDKTHGNKDQLRMPGSIGATGPAHVFKGQKMPGQMGHGQVTIKNIKIVEIDQDNSIIYINGSVPGARNTMVLVSGQGDLQLASEKKEEEKKEEPVKEVKEIEQEKKEEASIEEKIEEPKEEVKEESPVEEKIEKDEIKE